MHTPGSSISSPLTIQRRRSAALARVEACGCDRGCPSCVLLPGCGEYNEGLDKGGAALLLRWMVRGEEIEEPGVCKPCEAAS